MFATHLRRTTLGDVVGLKDEATRSVSDPRRCGGTYLGFFLTETNKWLVEYNDGQNRANETLFHPQQIVDKITGNPI